MNETTTTTAPAPVDRAAIRAALEANHAAYKDAVARIPADNWKSKSGNTAFSRGQLAWHIASSLSFIAGQIEGANKGKGTNPPAFLMPMLYKASELRIRFASRKATPASVLSDFDAGIKRLFGILDVTDDAALPRSATSFGETKTIAEMFHTPVEHMEEHASDMARNG